MDGGNQVQVPKVVWWRRSLPDVLTLLLLLIIVRPETPAHTLLVLGLLLWLWSWMAGGMLVLAMCAMVGAFWGWLGGETHKELAGKLALALLSPWLP